MLNFENVGGEWLDKDTFIIWEVALTEEIQNKLSDLIGNDEVWLCIEYWKDKDEIKYLLTSEYESECVNNIIQTKELDELVMKQVDECKLQK